jgi:hypothetical protein
MGRGPQQRDEATGEAASLTVNYLRQTVPLFHEIDF